MEPPTPPVASQLDTLAQETGIRRVSLALGVFDGVHRGHQLILRDLCEAARRTGSVPVAVSFTPHPRAVLTPETAPLLLTRDSQRIRLLGRYGARAVVLLSFDHILANLSPEAFLEQHLFSGAVRIEAICVGYDWRFGRRGAGNVELLQHAAVPHGTQVASLPPFTLYGKPVSSTRIRDAVAAGRLVLAQRLLGRPYAVAGTVVHGKGIGRSTFHCPTANVDATGMVLPPQGVYAATVRRQASPQVDQPAIAYIGSAPTVADKHAPRTPSPARVEVHLFDFDGNLYGNDIEVEFTEFLRGDRQFPSAAALREQIRRDMENARRQNRSAPTGRSAGTVESGR